MAMSNTVHMPKTHFIVHVYMLEACALNRSVHKKNGVSEPLGGLSVTCHSMMMGGK